MITDINLLRYKLGDKLIVSGGNSNRYHEFFVKIIQILQDGLWVGVYFDNKLAIGENKLVTEKRYNNRIYFRSEQIIRKANKSDILKHEI